MQDDWRVNDKLTLNLGLRYEVETPLTERNDKSVSGFDFGYAQPIQGTAQAGTRPSTIPRSRRSCRSSTSGAACMFAGPDTETTYKTPKNSFLPRVGFAYQVNPKTVVRGGVGLFAGFLGQRRGDVIQPGYSQTTTISTTFNAFGAPIPYDWENALLTTPILEPVGNALGRQTSLGQRDHVLQPEPGRLEAAPLADRLPARTGVGLTAEAVYVGNYGYDIEIFRNINALPNAYLNADNSRTAAMNANNTFLSAQVTNPFAGLLPGSGINNAHDRPPAAAAAVPGIRRHQHHQQRRQVLVPLRCSPACRSGSRRATRWACPTPTRAGCRRPST